MKNWLRSEELFMLLFSFVMFTWSDYSWWMYALLFLAPDLSFIAYAINPRTGAIAYNLAHHKGLALAIYVIGLWFNAEWALWVGSVFFGHASFDRILGYGLKYTDSFHHTHLGYIGKTRKGGEVT